MTQTARKDSSIATTEPGTIIDLVALAWHI